MNNQTFDTPKESPMDILKKSPMFNFSLGSKELFHSNFFAWLAETYPKQFAGFLNEIYEDTILDEDWEKKGFSVKREYENFDLCICKKFDKGKEKPVIVIENKVKSIAYKEQLEKYEEKVRKLYGNKKPECKYLLFTMHDVPNDICKGWKVVQYDKIIEAIKRNFENIIDKYNKKIIDDYRTFVSALNVLMEEWNNDDVYYLKDANKVMASLKELRLNDLYWKLKMSKMKEKLKEKIKEMLKNSLKKLLYNDDNIKIDYTNGSGILTLEKIYCTNVTKAKISIRIQIQGNQYRRVLFIEEDNEISEKRQFEIKKWWMEKMEKKNKNEDSVFYKFYYFSDLNQSEKFQTTNKDTVKTQRNIKDKDYEEELKELPYNSYLGKTDFFIYRYVKIKEGTKISDIIEQILRDCEYIEKYGATFFK